MSYYVVSTNNLIVATDQIDNLSQSQILYGPYPSKENAHQVAVNLRNGRKPDPKPLKGTKEPRRLICE